MKIRNTLAAVAASLLTMATLQVAYGQARPATDGAPATLFNKTQSGPSNLITSFAPPSFNNIVPSVHLKQFSMAASPVVCFIGDSTVSQGNYVAQIESLLDRIERKMREENPQKSITFKDYSIGGTTAANFISATQPQYPSWYTNHSSTWTSYVAAANCNTIFVNFGINDAGNESTSTLVTDIFTPIVGYSTSADIILITNGIANAAAGSPYNTATYVYGAPANQMLQRTISTSGASMGVSGLPPIGLIDIGRFQNIEVYGRDFVAQPLTYSINPSSPVSGITTFPYSFPQTLGGDFSLSVTFTNGSAWSTGPAVAQFLLADPQGGSSYSFGYTLNFETTNGSLCYENIYYGGPLVTGVVGGIWTSTNNTIEIDLQGDHYQTYCNGTLIQDQLLPRSVTTFTPVVQFPTAVTGGTSMTINWYAYGTPNTYATELSTTNCYGSTGGPNSGNGINHDSSYCLNQVYGPVIDAVNFRATSQVLTAAPTVTSGLGTVPVVAAPSGVMQPFQITVGSTGTPSTSVVLGFPAAPNGWTCPQATDQNSSSKTGVQTANTATSVTYTFSSAPSTSDVLLFPACGAH